jgi:capsular exopolysaccharide synthesis family protein
MLLVYLLELADSTLHSGEDARTTLALPCYAMLPEVSRRRLGASRVDEYAVRKPISPFAEQLRALRAGLWLGTDRPGVVAITSTRAAEGKTSVALALARAAAMGGERVLVIECDLRHPTFSRLMRSKPAPAGLADCLRGKAKPQEVIQHDAITGLDIIEAGRVGIDVPDLFLSGAIAEILDSLRDEYDLIVLDSPPAQSITEARIVAGLADATLVCVRWRATPRDVLLQAVTRLEEAHAHVVGTVLTRVDARAHLHSGHADADVYYRRRS